MTNIDLLKSREACPPAVEFAAIYEREYAKVSEANTKGGGHE